MFQGKSEQMRQYAEEHDIEVIDIKLSEVYPSYSDFILKWTEQTKGKTMTLYMIQSENPDTVKRIDNVIEVTALREQEIVEFAILDENGNKKVYRIETCVVSLESN